MRKVDIVTTSRADYGIYRPILQALSASGELEPRLLATGTHLSPNFGNTISTIEEDAFAPIEKVEMLLSSDSPEGVAKSMGLGTLGFAQLFGRRRPEILVVLGDRFEMHAAALAAVPFGIPLAHIHGGEVTEGAIDEALRHSMTKMSHLHFVSTDAYARRVIQMGEEPWRVTVSGAPSLDNLRTFIPMEPEELLPLIPMDLPDGGFLLVTFHPVTLEYTQAGHQTEELLGALSTAGLPCVFTLPNADTANRAVRKRIQEHVANRPGSRAVESLGTRGYFSLMSKAATMVGNSSSGLIEAPSFDLPVVNVGNRQRGRVRAANVIDCDCDRQAIRSALARALDPDFRASLTGMANPYGDGHASERIVKRLADVRLDERLLKKQFHDLA